MDENDKNTKTNKQNNFDLNEIVKKDTYNNLEQKNRFGIEVQNNNKLPKVLADFLSYLETIKGKSYNTIEAYKIDLSLFFKYLKVYKGYYIPDDIEFEEIPINDLDETFLKSIDLSDLYAFLSFVEKQRNNGTYARARKVATIKSYFNYLHGKAKIITYNPAAELESPKINKRHPIYLTLEESVSLLSSLDEKNCNYLRDYCILTLFLNCGMRLSELCSIKIDKIKGDTLTIIGKGNKERTVYLNEACISSIEDYLAKRNDNKAT
ncbi:tyrosine-type recombinase/integrase, partial [Clostridium saudiense]